MSVKLVAIDCDNTLLNSKGHITEENKETIQYLKKKGVEFIIATGRNDILVADYIDELGIEAPIIGCNGASIRKLKENKMLSYSPISKNSLKLVIDYCERNKLPFRAFSMEKGFSNDKESIKEVLEQILSKYTKILKNNISYELIENLSYLTENEEIIKVVLVDNDFELIKKYQKDLKDVEGIETCRSAVNCLDICAFGVSKGTAFKKYAEMLKIPRDETAAFGDSENDLSMIKYAGIGVAMENGDDEVKSAADVITLSNDESGVAKALKKIFSEYF